MDWFTDWQEFTWIVVGPVIAISLSVLISASLIIAVIRLVYQALTNSIMKGGE